MYWMSLLPMPPPDSPATGLTLRRRLVRRVLGQEVVPNEIHHFHLAVFALGNVHQPHVNRALVRITRFRVGHTGDGVAHAVEPPDVAGDACDQHLRRLQRRALGSHDAQLEIGRVLGRA